MQPTIQIPQLPQLKSDGTFDTPAVQRFFEDIQETLQSKQLADYNNSADLNTKITGVGNGIIESSYNTNGRWVKFRDGTLIQWVIALQITMATSLVQYTINFPMSFYGANNFSPMYFVGPASHWSWQTIGLQMVSQSYNYLEIYNSGASQLAYVYCIAIGRWKA